MQHYLQLEDQSLIHLISSGDEQAFTVLYNRHKDKLYAFAMDLVGSNDKAYDLVQEVFLKIWEQRASFAEREIFATYLYQMVRNFSMDYFRTIVRESTLYNMLSASEKEAVLTPESFLEYRDLQKKVQIAINNLPPRQKEIYIMHKEERLKYNEIAERLNLSVSTVENHFCRAIGSIRLYLNSEYSTVFFYCLVIGLESS
jgi:RNA polymerase sigma-70 factor (ECF subfamily)